MANPLYGRANGPPSKPDVYTDPKEKAFTFLVPPGWKAEGELLRAGRGGRYIVFSVTGPDGSLVYSGHPDLPQRYFVPGPWHGHIQPGRRTKMNPGNPAEEDMFAAPLASAPQACQYLAARRFGPVVMQSATQLPDMMRETYQSAMQAGVQLPFIDACRAEFASQDGTRVGAIQLVVFGGGNPGATWQVENISGYWCPAAAKATAAGAHAVIMASLKASDDWQTRNPDEVKQAAHDFVDKEFRKADEKDRAGLLAVWQLHQKTSEDITRGNLALGEKLAGQRRGVL